MRISTKSYMDLLHQSVQKAEYRLGVLTQQIASGKRIQNPSDDPVGAGQALRAHAALEKSLSDQSTLDHALRINNALDATLGQMTYPLQTALDAALRATQIGLGETGLAACATEVRAAMEQLVTCGNAEFNGIYLLAGTDNRQPPLTTTSDPTDVVTYSGNEQAMQIVISPGRVAPLTMTGQYLFNFADGAGERPVQGVDESVFQVMDNLAAAIEADDSAGIAEYREKLTAMQRHILQARGVAGAYGLRLEQSLTLAKDTELQSRIVLAEIEDIDMMNALLEATQQQTFYQAALTATAQIARMPTLFDRL
jgi:flagellar hook-associated protein 3 FlgL